MKKDSKSNEKCKVTPSEYVENTLREVDIRRMFETARGELRLTEADYSTFKRIYQAGYVYAVSFIVAFGNKTLEEINDMHKFLKEYK